MKIANRFLMFALLSLITFSLLNSCKTSGEIKMKNPAVKVKVEFEHKAPKHKCKKCDKHDCKHLKKKDDDDKKKKKDKDD